MKTLNRQKINHYQLWLASLIFLLSFISWTCLVAVNSKLISQFDQAIISHLPNNPALTAFFKIYTHSADTAVITCLVILITLTLLCVRQWSLALFTAASIMLANACNSLLKDIIQRPRPTVTHLVYANGFSFPSGHSVGSMSLALALVIITSFLVKNRSLRTILQIVFISWSILIACSRIYLHVHYPSDVFGGLLEALFFALLSYAILLQVKTIPQNS